jgi:hypothetical protein
MRKDKVIKQCQNYLIQNLFNEKSDFRLSFCREKPDIFAFNLPG